MIKQIKLSKSNVYLIKSEENNECILVDTGSKNDKELLLKEISNEKIKLIIVTHGHNECIGNIKTLQDKFNCDVYMNKYDYDLFDNELAHDIYTDGFMNKLVLNKYLKENEKVSNDMPSKINDAVNGDTFAKYGFNDIKIVGLSGHTRGSIGVLVGKKDLIIGDILINKGKMISVPVFYEEKASLENSLEQIKDILPSKLYPLEGDIFNYDDYFQMEKIVLNKVKSKTKKK